MCSKATGPGDLTLGPQPFPGPAALATWGLLRGFSPCLAVLSDHSSFISKLLGDGEVGLSFGRKYRYGCGGWWCLLLADHTGHPGWRKGSVGCLHLGAFESERGMLLSMLSGQDSGH